MPHLTRAERADKVTQTEARRRKEVALARLREMEAAERARQLLLAQEVRLTWTTVAALIREAILSLPDRAAPVVVAAKDVREARELLAGECEAILTKLSEEIEHARF
jgi:hypothetical protein